MEAGDHIRPAGHSGARSRPPAIPAFDATDDPRIPSHRVCVGWPPSRHCAARHRLV